MSVDYLRVFKRVDRGESAFLTDVREENIQILDQPAGGVATRLAIFRPSKIKDRNELLDLITGKQL